MVYMIVIIYVCKVTLYTTLSKSEVHGTYDSDI